MLLQSINSKILAKYGKVEVYSAKNIKLLKGDKIKLTHLIPGQELLISEIIRREHLFDPYKRAKNSFHKSIEKIA